MNITKSIFVTFQREGIHCYPEALENPKLEDVSFLGYPHRHMFHFKVEVPVEDSNREIEFIQLKRWCEALFESGLLQLNNLSCEMIAQDVGEQIQDAYDLNWVQVTVSEDGENGAAVLISKE